jgi:hypothetical protein
MTLGAAFDVDSLTESQVLVMIATDQLGMCIRPGAICQLCTDLPLQLLGKLFHTFAGFEFRVFGTLTASCHQAQSQCPDSNGSAKRHNILLLSSLIALGNRDITDL